MKRAGIYQNDILYEIKISIIEIKTCDFNRAVLNQIISR